MLANSAVPIFFPHPLVALLALLPVVAVESVILRRLGLRVRQVFVANFFSAILGGFLAILCLAVLGETFNIFISKDGTPFWVVLVVVVAVAVPCLSVH